MKYQKGVHKMSSDRKIQKHFYLSDYEAKVLSEKSYMTGGTEADYIRRIILDYTPIAAPEGDFFKVLEKLRKIGNNINQITAVANATGNIKAKELEAYKKKLDEVILYMKLVATRPRRKYDLNELLKEISFFCWETIEMEDERIRIVDLINKLLDKHNKYCEENNSIE